ncbi:MAG: CHAT domain-containing protein, partial [Spirulina sp.]
GLVASGDIWGEKGTADGNILVSAHGHLTLNDRWSTTTQWEDAGNITLLARGNIEVEDLTASSSGEGNGGEISIVSQWGRILTQNIDTTVEDGFGGDVAIAADGSIATENIITSSSLGESGGAIWLFSADGSINTEVLDSSADEGNGGDISLRSPGNIAIAYLNAEGLDFGGLAHISTDSYFRATGSFLSQNHLSASISTAGHLGGGSISIYHGGGEWTPFEVGSAEVNGTQGAITTGEYSLLPYEVFDSDFQDGDILISTNDPFLDDPSLGDPFHDMEFDPEEENTDLEFEENLSEEFDFFLENAELPQEELAREIEDNIEEHFTEEFATHLGVSEVANTTPEQAQQTLRDIERLTGIKPALVYAVFTADEPAENPLKSSRKDDGKLLWQSPQNTNANHQNFLPKHQTRRETDRLELVVVTAEGGVTRKPLPATREHVLKVANEYRRSVTNLRRPGAYLRPARELYQLLIAPLETHLQAQGINNLSFIMDAGLRGMPLAALHDGEQFAIEKYSLGMMPSLSLTDTNYRDLRDRQILAMGAETFSDQSDLPAVPVELSLITETLWSGKSYLNEEFTLDNFHAARQQGDYNILHLATHGEFKSGAPSNSYIQFWDRKLHLDRLQELKLNNPQIDLLVLSACRTALGDEQAELGFSGLAVMAGVKSALGSLWYVDDEGTLAFMSQFYDRLQTETTKAEALRQAQLAMLRGNLQVEGGKLITPRGGVELPPELAKIGVRNLAHPYYWGAFTLIGNPW